jgi:hypothetical protein
MRRNDPISKIVKTIASRLKYLSMKVLIGAPNFHISPAMRKKRRPREMIDAMMNIVKLIWNKPPVIVKSL